MPSGFKIQEPHGNRAYHHGLAGGLCHGYLSPPGTAVLTLLPPLPARPARVTLFGNECCAFGPIKFFHLCRLGENEMARPLRHRRRL